MNSIDIRTEKANAIFRYRSFQNITTLFRFIEICVFLVAISTFSSQLPFSVRISAEYFTGLFSFAGVNPRFVFVIGNVIILILLYKSRVAGNGDPYGKIDVFDEYVKRCEKSAGKSRSDAAAAVNEKKICRSQSEKMMRGECRDGQSYRKLTSSVAERRILKNVDGCGGVMPALEIRRDGESYRQLTSSVTERKLSKNVDGCGGEMPSPEVCRDGKSHRKLTSSVTERKLSKNVDGCGGEMPSPEVCTDGKSHRKLTSSVTERRILKNVDGCGGEKPSPEICRSQSEKMMRVEFNDGQSQRSQRELRRSVTERGMVKNGDCYGGETAAESGGVDELSSEAFRRTVEAFIARQQQSLRDEELAPVPYVGA